MTKESKRYAVVTGANKGIGFEICKQLARNGIIVVLTSRDKQRGLQAVRKLEDTNLSGSVVFHQLDVTRQDSVNSLAMFIRTQFGKLDILVNNAGAVGIEYHADARDRLEAMGLGKESLFITMAQHLFPPGIKPDYKEIGTETWEIAEDCLNTNYYGTKRMVEALMDLLQLSDSPRIVTNSSNWGRVENIPNKWARGVLSDVNNLNEERVDAVVKEFLNDFKQSSLLIKGWPSSMSAYIISKAASNAYTRVIAKKYPSVMVNSVCPGYVRTDIALNLGNLSAEEGAETIVRIVLFPKGGQSGYFFRRRGRDPILSRI